MDCSQCQQIAGDLGLICGLVGIWAGPLACEIIGLGPEDPLADACAVLFAYVCWWDSGNVSNACFDAGYC